MKDGHLSGWKGWRVEGYGLPNFSWPGENPSNMPILPVWPTTLTSLSRRALYKFCFWSSGDHFSLFFLGSFEKGFALAVGFFKNAKDLLLALSHRLYLLCIYIYHMISDFTLDIGHETLRSKFIPIARETYGQCMVPFCMVVIFYMPSHCWVDWQIFVESWVKFEW